MRFLRSSLLLAVPVALAACGDAKKAVIPEGQADTSVGATAEGDVVATDSAAAQAAAAADSAVEVARKDTNAVINVSIPSGRSKRDSISLVRAIRYGMRAPGWPVKGPTPKAGAILPAKRIIAFYGNPHSKKMGVLGEYATAEMLAKLDREVARWREADPKTPVQPALHLVSVVAQGAAGEDGMWRRRETDKMIQQVYDWAKSRNAILFLDIQTGHSTYQKELPPLMKWLEKPDVHLGIDPEFNMHGNREGVRPGAKIGTLDARDINWVAGQLADLVKRKNLPPKVLVVHRFTRPMVTNYKNVQLRPEVQIVMHMDGWGGPWLKFDSYKDYIVQEPVQYTGFKLFYHNDTKKGDMLLTPKELVRLVPAPLYIQYQ